jgi:exodeoxyribonuclease VII large subunit
MNQALTVSALTRYLKHKFTTDPHLQSVFLEGEISNFKHHSRGHFYFTLKDDEASISAIMFKADTMNLNFFPEEGNHVLVTGHISIFEKAGSYQIYVKTMEQQGLGKLYQAYLALKDSLEKEGYFNRELKKLIPAYPKGIALLTSNTGAAIKDMISTIQRRYPLIKIIVYPTAVQGERAKSSIALNIKRADLNPEVDVIIVGRGGGSIEDLWAFNERVVADAIYQANTPIISAVGHETDFTIADFVADLRAPTPTGAAEMAVPNKNDIQASLKEKMKRLKDMNRRMISQKEERLSYLLMHPILSNPLKLIDPYLRSLTDFKHQLSQNSPIQRMQQFEYDIKSEKKALISHFRSYLQTQSYHLEKMIQTLVLSSPQARLDQGYVLVYKNDKLIKKASELSHHDLIDIQFSEGLIKASVTKGETK